MEQVQLQLLQLLVVEFVVQQPVLCIPDVEFGTEIDYSIYTIHQQYKIYKFTLPTFILETPGSPRLYSTSSSSNFFRLIDRFELKNIMQRQSKHNLKIQNDFYLLLLVTSELSLSIIVLWQNISFFSVLPPLLVPT